MSELEKIESILLHEIGHLLINILLVEKHPDLSIKELVLRNYDCHNVSWCGWVKLEPDSLLDYEEVIKNKSLTFFKFLSLKSGCLFQSLYAPDKIKFDDCFAFKETAIGKGDHDQSSKLMSQLAQKYSQLRGNMEFFDSHDSIIQNEFVDLFLSDATLKKELKNIISPEAVKIQADLLASNDVKKYHYIYRDEELNKLIKSISEVITNRNLTELIDGLILKLINNLENNINKI